MRVTNQLPKVLQNDQQYIQKTRYGRSRTNNK